jgi:hypothetical protein
MVFCLNIEPAAPKVRQSPIGTPSGAALRACPGSKQEGPARAVERPTSGETAGAGGCLFAHLGKLRGSVRRGS